MIKPENFAVMQGWMVTQLHLKGTELMVFAIVHGFTQHENGGGFVGGIAYLTEWTGTTSRTVISILQRLEERGLIRKEMMATPTGKRLRIRSLVECEMISPPSQESAGECEMISPPVVKNFHEGGENFSHRNISNNPTSYEVGNNKAPAAPREDPAAALDPTVREAFRDYVQMRTKIKAPMTNKAKALAIDDLKKLASDPAKQVAILNQSTMNSWKGLYELKEERENQKQSEQPKGTFFAFPQREIDEEDEETLELRLRKKALGKD